MIPFVIIYAFHDSCLSKFRWTKRSLEYGFPGGRFWMGMFRKVQPVQQSKLLGRGRSSHLKHTVCTLWIRDITISAVCFSPSRTFRNSVVQIPCCAAWLWNFGQVKESSNQVNQTESHFSIQNSIWNGGNHIRTKKKTEVLVPWHVSATLNLSAAGMQTTTPTTSPKKKVIWMPKDCWCKKGGTFDLCLFLVQKSISTSNFRCNWCNFQAEKIHQCFDELHKPRRCLVPLLYPKVCPLATMAPVLFEQHESVSRNEILWPCASEY